MPDYTESDLFRARERLYMVAGEAPSTWLGVADDYGDRASRMGVVVDPRHLRIVMDDAAASRDELARLAAILDCQDDPMQLWDRVNALVLVAEQLDRELEACKTAPRD